MHQLATPTMRQENVRVLFDWNRASEQEFFDGLHDSTFLAGCGQRPRVHAAITVVSGTRSF
jgi:hypothetical protein